jgi:hypothetical protein
MLRRSRLGEEVGMEKAAELRALARVGGATRASARVRLLAIAGVRDGMPVEEPTGAVPRPYRPAAGRLSARLAPLHR